MATVERQGRQRVPAPLLKYRMATGRGALEQPNVTGDGEHALTPAFWLAVVLTGVATGVLGDLLMALLFAVQHLAFDYRHGEFQDAVEHVSDLRRVLVLVLAGAVGGPAWYLLRRATPGEISELDDALWRGDGKLSWRRSAGTSVISEVVIGMGASIGREAAPKLMGGVSGSVAAGWLGLTVPQRRLLVACGGGAGVAAVYNVPLAGALFAAEILCGSLILPVVLPALVCAAIATCTAWIYLPRTPTYLDVPHYPVTASLVVWSVLAGPLLGILAATYVRIIGWVSFHRLRDRAVLLGPLAVFTLLGLIGTAYPQLFGNGKDLAHSAFLGSGSLGLLLVLFALKPLVTALCLGSGANGGLLTPMLSTGALLGAFLGLAWTHAWSGTAVGAFALVGAAAMVGASMQAPVVGLVLVLELTSSGFGLTVPMVAATATATAVARRIDGYSIYSARLPA